MSTINVHEAKTHFSRLLEQVRKGEEVVIARGGVPVAKLVPLTDLPRQPGRLRGRIIMGPDFDAPLPEPLLAAFRGEVE